MTHTPGPWTYDIGRTNGHFGWSIYSGDARIATVYANYVNIPSSPGENAANPQNAESVANARLIAAAPQLLEACKAAYEWSAKYPLGTESYQADVDAARIVYHLCQAAIADAEGGEK